MGSPLGRLAAALWLLCSPAWCGEDKALLEAMSRVQTAANGLAPDYASGRIQKLDEELKAAEKRLRELYPSQDAKTLTLLDAFGNLSKATLAQAYATQIVIQKTGTLRESFSVSANITALMQHTKHMLDHAGAEKAAEAKPEDKPATDLAAKEEDSKGKPGEDKAAKEEDRARDTSASSQGTDAELSPAEKRLQAPELQAFRQDRPLDPKDSGPRVDLKAGERSLKRWETPFDAKKEESAPGGGPAGPGEGPGAGKSPAAPGAKDSPGEQATAPANPSVPADPINYPDLASLKEALETQAPTVRYALAKLGLSWDGKQLLKIDGGVQRQASAAETRALVELIARTPLAVRDPRFDEKVYEELKELYKNRHLHPGLFHDVELQPGDPNFRYTATCRRADLTDPCNEFLASFYRADQELSWDDLLALHEAANRMAAKKPSAQAKAEKPKRAARPAEAAPTPAEATRAALAALGLPSWLLDPDSVERTFRDKERARDKAWRLLFVGLLKAAPAGKRAEALGQALDALASEDGEGLRRAKALLKEKEPGLSDWFEELWQAQAEAEAAELLLEKKASDPAIAPRLDRGLRALRQDRETLLALYAARLRGELPEGLFLRAWPGSREFVKERESWGFESLARNLERSLERGEARAALDELRTRAAKDPEFAGDPASPAELLSWAAAGAAQDSSLRVLLDRLAQLPPSPGTREAVADIVRRLDEEDPSGRTLNAARFNELRYAPPRRRAELLAALGLEAKRELFLGMARQLSRLAQGEKADREDLELLAAAHGSEWGRIAKEPGLLGKAAQEWLDRAQNVGEFLSWTRLAWPEDKAPPKTFPEGGLKLYRRACKAAGFLVFDPEDYLASETRAPALTPRFEEALARHAGGFYNEPMFFKNIPPGPDEEDLYGLVQDALESLKKQGLPPTVDNLKQALGLESSARNLARLTLFMDLYQQARLETAFAESLAEAERLGEERLMDSLGLGEDHARVLALREKLPRLLREQFGDWETESPELSGLLRQAYGLERETAAFAQRNLRALLLARGELDPAALGLPPEVREVRLDTAEGPWGGAVQGFTQTSLLPGGGRLEHFRGFDGARARLRFIPPEETKAEPVTVELSGLQDPGLSQGLVASLSPGGKLRIGRTTLAKAPSGRLEGRAAGPWGEFEGTFDFDETTFELRPWSGRLLLGAGESGYLIYEKGMKTRGRLGPDQEESLWEEIMVEDPEKRGPPVKLQARARQEGDKRVPLDAFLPRLDPASGKLLGYYGFMDPSGDFSTKARLLVVPPEAAADYLSLQRHAPPDALAKDADFFRADEVIQIVVKEPLSAHAEEEVLLGRDPARPVEKRVYAYAPGRSHLKRREVYQWDERGRLRSRAIHGPDGTKSEEYYPLSDVTAFYGKSGALKEVREPVHAVKTGGKLEIYYLLHSWDGPNERPNLMAAVEKDAVDPESGKRSRLIDLWGRFKLKGSFTGGTRFSIDRLRTHHDAPFPAHEKEELLAALAAWFNAYKEPTLDDHFKRAAAAIGEYVAAPLEILTGAGAAAVAYLPTTMLASWAVSGDLGASRALFGKGVDIAARQALTRNALEAFWGKEKARETYAGLYKDLGLYTDADGNLHAEEGSAGVQILDDFKASFKSAVAENGGKVPAELFFSSPLGSMGYVSANYERFRTSREPLYLASAVLGQAGVVLRDAAAFEAGMLPLVRAEAWAAKSASSLSNPWARSLALKGAQGTRTLRVAAEARYIAGPSVEAISEEVFREWSKGDKWIASGKFLANLGGMAAYRLGKEAPLYAQARRQTLELMARGEISAARGRTRLNDLRVSKLAADVAFKETAGLLLPALAMDRLGLSGPNAAALTVLAWRGGGGAFLERSKPTGEAGAREAGRMRLSLLDELTLSRQKKARAFALYEAALDLSDMLADPAAVEYVPGHDATNARRVANLFLVNVMHGRSSAANPAMHAAMILGILGNVPVEGAQLLARLSPAQPGLVAQLAARLARLTAPSVPTVSASGHGLGGAPPLSLVLSALQLLPGQNKPAHELGHSLQYLILEGARQKGILKPDELLAAQNKAKAGRRRSYLWGGRTEDAAAALEAGGSLDVLFDASLANLKEVLPTLKGPDGKPPRYTQSEAAEILERYQAHAEELRAKLKGKHSGLFETGPQPAQ